MSEVIETPTTSENTSNSTNGTTSNVTPRKIIVKPRSVPFSFNRRIPMTSSALKIRHVISNNATNGTNETNDQGVSTEQPIKTVPRLYSKFTSPAMIVVNRNTASSKSKNITRMPIMIKKQCEASTSNPIDSNYKNQISHKNQTSSKKQPTRSISPFDKPKTLDFNIHIATERIDVNPRLAITSEPLLLHYQDVMISYKRQVRDLQNEIKNYRRREDQLKKKNKGPQIVSLCKKPFMSSSGSVKRKIAKQLREAVDLLLKDCSPEDKKAAFMKAFPEIFEQNASQSKLDTEQTWTFERKFKLNNGMMDRFRCFLNQHNANPFASRRQINNYRTDLEKINPALLNVQPAEDSSPANSEEEIDEEGYVPNITRVAQANNSRRQITLPTIGATTTSRGEPYSSNSIAAAQYGQQLIQQEQYLRRLQTVQSYNVVRQTQANPQQEQYVGLPRQQQPQTTVPSAFQPANSTYSNYTSLYNGHY